MTRICYNETLQTNQHEVTQNIRIHHECEDGIEKSVPRITNWQQEACRGLLKIYIKILRYGMYTIFLRFSKGRTSDTKKGGTIIFAWALCLALIYIKYHEDILKRD